VGEEEKERRRERLYFEPLLFVQIKEERKREIIL
jgi:hypothetical protein